MLGRNFMGIRLGFFLAVILLGALGCSEDEKILAPAGEPVSSLPFPGSPDQLMANFKTMYETRDYREFELIMAPGFETILQQETIEEFPDVGETLDLTEELRIHDRMFSGNAVTDPNGDLVPGVTSISFWRFTSQGNWADSPPTDIIPDSEWALYDVEFLLSRGQTFSTLKVRGNIKFYVTSRDSLHEGMNKPYYQMIGQVDLTNVRKGVEESSWGTVKAVWR